MWAIESCRTSVLGGHLDVCDACGYQRPAYNSCRNRHCPKCQCLAQAHWIEQRAQRILPTHHFHVVFTLPGALRRLALYNRRLIFTLLFRAASQTLLTMGRDPRRLGGLLGVTAVLHTWTRKLHFHPHLHCIVTGGGLSLDDHRWVATKNSRYLFPVRALSTLFRGKLLNALRRAYRRGKLRGGPDLPELRDDPAFDRFIDSLYRQPWVVYAKKPFAGADHVFQYLGRYTHRVAISNQRIKAVDGNSVRFVTRGGDTSTLTPDEFIRRFLQHVLPAGFVKIRHYGLLAPAKVSTALERARALLNVDAAVPENNPVPSLTLDDADWRAKFARLTGVDLVRCPRCEIGAMIRHPLPQAALPRPDG